MAVNRADKQYLDHVWPWDVRDFDGESYVTRSVVQRKHGPMFTTRTSANCAT
jgi:hypothetical protein